MVFTQLYWLGKTHCCIYNNVGVHFEMTNEVIFGNKETFGIRYLPDWTAKGENYRFAKLHLVFKGQVIGDPNESSLVGTWVAGLKRISKIIEVNFDKLSNAEFKNKTDYEVFELIYKSNQLEENYKGEYRYLNQLDNEVWQYCNISIDETTDAFQIVMTADGNNLKFLWKGLREPYNPEQIEMLNSVKIERDYVLKVIEECILTVTKETHN